MGDILESRSEEVSRKVGRLARAAGEAGLDGVLLSSHWNFSWLTAGASNRIDISREAGAGSLLVAADGRRFVLANTIEMPRLMAEALAGLDFQPVDFRWTDERADPSMIIRRARQVLGASAIGIDAPAGPAGEQSRPFEAQLSRLRSDLDQQELTRYRALGADLGRAVGAVMHGVPPGVSERELAQEVGKAVLSVGADPLALLAAGDDRLLHYRHPIPTSHTWTSRVMAVVTAAREGLTVSLSRLLTARPADATIARRLDASGQVLAALLRASVPGASASSLFETAAAAYAAAGFPGQELEHHQGGLTGYRSREWVAHPASTEHVPTRAALAWNPSVTGTKVEETGLLTDAGIEVITSSPGWPSHSVDVNGLSILIPDQLVLER